MPEPTPEPANDPMSEPMLFPVESVVGGLKVRTPQSAQSVPGVQKVYSKPGPPSSQFPSSA
eukprot:2590949-Prymnesium_polylepis.2